MKNNVRELRLKKNLSQTQLARLIDAKPNTITCWEMGIRNPNNIFIPKLIKVLNCSLDELFMPIDSKEN